jgi:hypothetical protein
MPWNILNFERRTDFTSEILDTLNKKENLNFTNINLLHRL